MKRGIILNILHVIDTDIWGGIEQLVHDICKKQNNNNNKSFVLIEQDNDYIQKRYLGVASVLPLKMKCLGGIFSINKLVEMVKDNKIEVIYCHSGRLLSLCIAVKKKLGIKVFAYKHNTLPSKKDPYHYLQRKWIDGTICVSRIVFDTQTEGLSNDEKKKFHVIYNGIDTDKYNKYEYGKFCDTKVFSVGFAGRISEGKGVEYLLDAFRLLASDDSNVRLHLAGPCDKGYYQKLIEIIAEMGLQDKVIFWGIVDDMEKFYKSLNVFVLPSLLKESFGLVLCEALYCGLPVITTITGAQKEIVKDSAYGLMIDNIDAKNILKCIKYYRNDKMENRLKRSKYIEETFNIVKSINDAMLLCKS